MERRGDARGDAAGRARSIKEPNGATGGTTDGRGGASAEAPASKGRRRIRESVGQGGGAHEEGVGFSVVVGVVDAGRGDEAVGRKGQVDSAVDDVAVDHFGPTARQINNLLKPITTPIRNEWMNLKPETRRVLKGGFFGAFFGNLILGWPARATASA